MKKIRYTLEACILHLFYFLFSLLPVRWASEAGGFLGRMIGPKLATSRKARSNIRIAFPDILQEEEDKILREMWDNLGRVMAEYPHLETLSRNHVSLTNQSIIDAHTNNGPALFLGGHLGNWEVNCASSIFHGAKPVHITYRAPNNPAADRLLMKARTLDGRLKAYPKGREGGAQMMRALKNGDHLGMMIDQKYNEGLAVPFFGQPAMTNPVFVQMAQKYKAALIPIQNIRRDGPQFELVVHEPLVIFDADGAPLPVEDVIHSAHVVLESWIRENPGQWLWLHRRWDSKQLKDDKEHD